MAFLAGVCLLAGCSAQDAVFHESVSESDDRLIITTNQLWASSDFPLTVCFQSTGDGSSSERLAVRSAVETAWASIPGSKVSFTGWGTCANDSSSGDIRIFLDSSVTRGSSYYGTDNQVAGRHMVLRTPESSYNTNLTYSYIHEFGHALGIQHEQAHPDSTCSDTESLISGAVAATAYDPDAVMNYCAPFPQALSPYETLFPKMVYPDGSALPIACKSGCLSGSSVFLRSDGSVQDSFTAQGAYPWWASGAGTLAWSQDGFSAGTGAVVTAAAIGSGVSNVSYGGTVTYTGTSVSGAGTVRVGNSEWTAIASTFL